MEKDTYLLNMYKVLNGVSKSNFSDFISNAENSYSELKSALGSVSSQLTNNIWDDKVKNTFDETFNSHNELLDYCTAYNEEVIVPLSLKTDDLATKLKAYNDGVAALEEVPEETPVDDATFYKKVFENMGEWFKNYDYFKADVDKYFKLKDASSDSGVVSKSIYDNTMGAYNEHNQGTGGEGNALLDDHTPEGERKLFDFQNDVKTRLDSSYDKSYKAFNENGTTDNTENENAVKDLAIQCYECIKDINRLLDNTSEVSRIEGIIASLGGAVATAVSTSSGSYDSYDSDSSDSGDGVETATTSIGDTGTTNVGVGAGIATGVGGAVGAGAVAVGTSSSTAAGGGSGTSSGDGQGTQTGSKIHFISTGASDAILIESNGHFGLVDTSNPYNDGTHEQVSYSAHSVEHVKSYLRSVGVKMLDFLIGTHAHSDHVGGVPEIAANFVDSNTAYYYRPYVTTNEDYTNPAWDNAGYASRALSAMAAKTGKLINVTGQHITFNLGDFLIKLLNTEPASIDEMVNGVAKGDNKNSIVALVTYKGMSSTLLAADMEYEDEPKVGNAVGHVEIFKMAHHGYDSATSLEFVNKLTPRNVIITNASFPVDESKNNSGLVAYLQNTMGTNVYLTGKTANSIIVNYDDAGYQILNPETIINKMSYESQGSWIKANGQYWLYNKNGTLAADEWIQDNGIWYYLTKKGVMATGWQELVWQGVTNWYYFDASGAMATGWKQLGWSGGVSWFYFGTNGAMVKNTQMNINGKVYIFNGNGVCTNP